MPRVSSCHLLLLLFLLGLWAVAIAQEGEEGSSTELKPPVPDGLDVVPGAVAPIASLKIVNEDVAKPPSNGEKVEDGGTQPPQLLVPENALGTGVEGDVKLRQSEEEIPEREDLRGSATSPAVAASHANETDNTTSIEDAPSRSKNIEEPSKDNQQTEASTMDQPDFQKSKDHNPWRVPVPGRMPEEIQADSNFSFSWYPNTEGAINLELWKIENNAPVPKYMLAPDLNNTGDWTWHVHRNFPHGTGYCLVIVPTKDRQLASLSPLFTIIGPEAGDYNLPTSQAGHDGPVMNWNAIKANNDGASGHFIWALGIGFLVCNFCVVWAWMAWGGGHEGVGLGGGKRLGYEMVGKPRRSSSRKVFHAKTPTKGMD